MNISEELVKKCLQGKQSAYAELYEVSIGYAYSVACRYIDDKEAVKDVLQNAYAKTFFKIKQFDSTRGSFKFWFRRILVNECLSLLKDYNKLNILYSIDEIDESRIDGSDRFEQMTREDIEKYLQHIPAGYRTIFMLIVIDGYNHKDVAKMLNISKETSRSQLSRAKKAIQKHFMNKPAKKAYGFI